jgi:hypothetical protein
MFLITDQNFFAALEMAHHGTVFLDEIGEIRGNSSRSSCAGFRTWNSSGLDPHRRPVRGRHQSELEGNGGTEEISCRPLLSAERFSIECSALAGAP